MKAVILSISADAAIIDVSHDVAKFSTRMGAYVLASVAPYFPRGTIHVAVIDPGVGTRRRSLLIQTKRSFLVGPDNGLLIVAAKQQGIICIREITNTQLMLPRVSSTFHGRDVFAPAAAHLANKVAPAEFGPEIHDVVKPNFSRFTLRRGILVGEVWHVDSFGNIITNISSKAMRTHAVDMVKVQLPHHKLRLKLCEAYGEAQPQEPLVIIGSHGYLEIAINQGNAAKRLKVEPGDKIQITSFFKSD